MDGFGSDDVVTPFNYGSVSEAMSESGDRLDTKVKKKFWKAKQKMVEKLGREQDRFVVQGDSEIDSHIDSARKLQKSCEQLIDVLQDHMGSLQEISYAEDQLGSFLVTSSLNEHTSSAITMEKTGNLLSSISSKRIQVVPKLHQLQHDLGVFLVSAVKDMAKSIEHLEKARSEYRAAMLWLRNASAKLDDPDASKQLAKFREAQGTVKKAKQQFDKLKEDVTEKISMLNASRCSLLSRSLPSYQEVALDFFENASKELDTVLNDFKLHHHHQYRIKNEVQQETDTSEDLEPSSTTTHVSDAEDDKENQQLLDLASDDDHGSDASKKLTEKDAVSYTDSSYQAVDKFSQLQTAQTELVEPGSVQLDDADTEWLVSTSPITNKSFEEATAELDLLKIDSIHAPLVPATITSSVAPVTSSTTVSKRSSFTSSSPLKHQDNWDSLFAELDPLSNEKV